MIYFAHNSPWFNIFYLSGRFWNQIYWFERPQRPSLWANHASELQRLGHVDQNKFDKVRPSKGLQKLIELLPPLYLGSKCFNTSLSTHCESGLADWTPTTLVQVLLALWGIASRPWLQPSCLPASWCNGAMKQWWAITSTIPCVRNVLKLQTWAHVATRSLDQSARRSVRVRRGAKLPFDQFLRVLNRKIVQLQQAIALTHVVWRQTKFIINNPNGQVSKTTKN